MRFLYDSAINTIRSSTVTYVCTNVPHVQHTAFLCQTFLLHGRTSCSHLTLCKCFLIFFLPRIKTAFDYDATKKQQRGCWLSSLSLSLSLSLGVKQFADEGWIQHFSMRCQLACVISPADSKAFTGRVGCWPWCKSLAVRSVGLSIIAKISTVLWCSLDS